MATIKQKKAIVNLAENGGNVSKAMRDAGYTKVSAATPKKLTESKAFKSWADRIPDELLEKVHLEGLKATTVRFTPEGEQVDVDDYATRHKYLDTAHKLKGDYAPEKKKIEGSIDINDTSKLDKLIERMEEELDHDYTRPTSSA